MITTESKRIVKFRKTFVILQAGKLSDDLFCGWELIFTNILKNILSKKNNYWRLILIFFLVVIEPIIKSRVHKRAVPPIERTVIAITVWRISVLQMNRKILPGTIINCCITYIQPGYILLKSFTKCAVGRMDKTNIQLNIHVIHQTVKHTVCVNSES